MKGYYKNWYQHYLEVEKEKEKEVQRGYYSNLAEKKEVLPQREKAVMDSEKEHHTEIEVVPISGGRGKKRKDKKKGKFRIIGFFLPVMTIFGFVFLWYQMDVGPIRRITHEALVLAGIREEAVDVVSYHTSLLDQHTAFAEKIAAYITGEGETDFESLQLIYDEIRSQHLEIAQVSGDDYDEANRLWPFMLYSTSQMMNDLVTSDDIDDAHEQFVSDQEEIEAMIRNALGLDVDI